MGDVADRRCSAGAPRGRNRRCSIRARSAVHVRGIRRPARVDRSGALRRAWPVHPKVRVDQGPMAGRDAEASGDCPQHLAYPVISRQSMSSTRTSSRLPSCAAIRCPIPDPLGPFGIRAQGRHAMAAVGACAAPPCPAAIPSVVGFAYRIAPVCQCPQTRPVHREPCRWAPC